MSDLEKKDSLCSELADSTCKLGFYDPETNVFYQVECSEEEFKELS